MFKRIFRWCACNDSYQDYQEFDTALELLEHTSFSGQADLSLIVRFYDAAGIKTTEKRFSIGDVRLPATAPLDAIRELSEASNSISTQE